MGKIRCTKKIAKGCYYTVSDEEAIFMIIIKGIGKMFYYMFYWLFLICKYLYMGCKKLYSYIKRVKDEQYKNRNARI